MPCSAFMSQVTKPVDSGVNVKRPAWISAAANFRKAS